MSWYFALLDHFVFCYFRSFCIMSFLDYESFFCLCCFIRSFCMFDYFGCLDDRCFCHFFLQGSSVWNNVSFFIPPPPQSLVQSPPTHPHTHTHTHMHILIHTICAYYIHHTHIQYTHYSPPPPWSAEWPSSTGVWTARYELLRGHEGPENSTPGRENKKLLGWGVTISKEESGFNRPDIGGGRIYFSYSCM